MHFLDSNIWLYAMIRGSDAEKRRKAIALLRKSDAAISTQVVNEVCVNLRRKEGFDDERLERVINALHRRCAVVSPEKSCLLLGCKLRRRYSLSFWDSLIVAAALLAGCDTLYSEDMQDGLVVEGTLTIRNPFVMP